MALLASLGRPTLLILWLVVFVICGAIEGATVGLTAIWFCVGALGALLCSGIGLGFWPGFWVFVVISIACLILVRPLAQKHLNTKTQATNADRIIGQEGIVKQEINNLQNTGYVNIKGQEWRAVTDSDEAASIPENAKVRVVRIEGVKVVVERV